MSNLEFLTTWSTCDTWYFSEEKSQEQPPLKLRSDLLMSNDVVACEFVSSFDWNMSKAAGQLRMQHKFLAASAATVSGHCQETRTERLEYCGLSVRAITIIVSHSNSYSMLLLFDVAILKVIIPICPSSKVGSGPDVCQLNFARSLPNHTCQHANASGGTCYRQ